MCIICRVRVDGSVCVLSVRRVRVDGSVCVLSVECR